MNKQTNSSIRYCIYARKSMEAEERQALSIDSQLNEMKNIANRDGLNVVDIKTEAHSAKNTGEREVINSLISDIKSEKFNAILTWNADRLSRNAGDLGILVDLMDKGLLVEIRTFGQVFSCSPNDKFLLMILCSQAKLENDNKGINVQRGMRARVEAGLWPGVAPTGYLNSNLKDHLCIKDIDPVLAPIVKEMFEKVAYDDWTNKQLYFWLKGKGVKSRSGKYFNLSSIHEILNRTFYYGQFEFPKGSGKWYQGKHTPIISKELFDIVQETLMEHSSYMNRKKNRKDYFMFSRFMHCGLCGSGISVEEKFKRLKNGGFNRHVYYHCCQSRDKLCKDSYINENDLIEQLTTLLDTVRLDLIGMREELKEKVERYHGYNSYVNNLPIPERTEAEKENELRTFAKVVFKDGSSEEKMKIMKFLKGKVLLKNGKVYAE